MSQTTSSLFPVIMAGGSGTRFWPLSRSARPKQLLPLVSKNPLIVDTAARVKGLAKPAHTFVVCGKAHAPQIKKLLPQLPAANILVEPAARNTAPAIGLATVHVAAQNPQGILAVLPSDQHVARIPAFQAALREAADIARQGFIVTLGIKPSRPETGYGYIHLGEALDATARRVQAFVEKPDAETARRYLSSGDYLWNGGIFVFRADVMLDAFARHMPALDKGLKKLAASLGKRSYAAELARVFPKLPSESIDYGVAEKAGNIAVVPGDFGWSDVGSFSALPEVRQADAMGNISAGKHAFLIDSEGCIVLGNERPLAVVGMTDVVVVDTGDAVLVLPKGRSQDVRKVVEALKAKKLTQYL
jgi:mannose-1-phosphate guanylyltransferase